MKIDMSEWDTDKLDGPNFPEYGSYHFQIQKIEEEDAETQSMYADCEVLAGTVKGQEGKMHREYFSLKGKAYMRVASFAIALGLATKEELERCKAEGIEPDIDFQRAVNEGRQFCGRINKEVYQEKERRKLNFDMWPVSDKRAKGIPLNKAKLEELAARLKTPPAAGFCGADAAAHVTPAADPFAGAEENLF